MAKRNFDQIYSSFISEEETSVGNLKTSEELQTVQKAAKVIKLNNHVRMNMIDFSNDALNDRDENSSHIRKLEQLLKQKFSWQQAGKKKWLENRELKYTDFFPVEFINDQEFVLNHIIQYGYGLQYASPSVQADKAFVLRVVAHSGYEVLFASHNIRQDKEVMLKAVQENARAVCAAPDTLQNEKEFVLEAVRLNGHVLHHIPFYVIRHDKEIVLEAIKQTKQAMKAIRPFTPRSQFHVKRSQNSISRIRIVRIFDYSNKHVMLKVVQEFGFLLLYASNDLKRDRDIILNAMLKDDQEIVIEAIKQDVRAIRYASQKLWSDKQFLLEAVKLGCKNCLRNAPKEYAKDKEFVLQAIRHNCFGIIGDNYTCFDKEIMLEAVKNNGYALRFAIAKFRQDPEVVLTALKYSGYAMNYSDELYRERMKYCYYDAYMGTNH
ncbi:hypothetical protein C9374_004371 [Naegleria lovaniensis]|uniref:DUF4116 domain-containing protein n=1 Tax=Naegleria lovaniensis TaxID=51637 RepID=A0AA88GT85_NAELO|nr:uncharacterized protein C9374_004371 [Naegleria lovaniensis]KAG2383700.1 hypothetical protein C9374_004371 [Naegleria lovaniensis]